MKTEKWVILENDGDTVRLSRDLEDTYEESTLQRPDNTTPSEWHELWKVGDSFGADEFHDRVRFEAVRRNGKGVLNASEKWAVDRWNRPEPATKLRRDWLYTLARPVLAGIKQADSMKTTWLHTYARDLYLGLSSKHPDIATEYLAAISRNEAALLNFIDKHGDPSYVEPDQEEMERLEAELERDGLDFSKGKS